MAQNLTNIAKLNDTKEQMIQLEAYINSLIAGSNYDELKQTPVNSKFYFKTFLLCS